MNSNPRLVTVGGTITSQIHVQRRRAVAIAEAVIIYRKYYPTSFSPIRKRPYCVYIRVCVMHILSISFERSNLCVRTRRFRHGVQFIRTISFLCHRINRVRARASVSCTF